MNNAILNKVQDQIASYQADHHGQKPLYIILSDEEADKLATAIKQEEGYDSHLTITEWRGCTIARDAGMSPGEIRLSDELPATGS